MRVAKWVDAALHRLYTDGLLLESDPRLPSVTAIVAGEPIHGSWWGNPAARGTYEVLNALEDHPDALRTKLIDSKVTYVHRGLWPALLGVALADEAWQSRALPMAARWLLDEVAANGELERRLLVHATEMHTETGAHARVLETWQQWREVPEHQVIPVSAEDGRALLEARLAQLNDACGANARLPWQPPANRRSRHAKVSRV